MAAVVDDPKTSLELLQQYAQTKSRRLRDAIIYRNMGLVRKVAHRWVRDCREPYEDLEQVGVIGLQRAIELFDLSKGRQFSTFAIPKIRSEILHYLRDKSNPLKLPRRWQDGRRRALTMAAGGATIEQIAAATKIKAEEVTTAVVALQYRPLASLDFHPDEEEGSSWQLADAGGDIRIDWVYQLLNMDFTRRDDGLINATQICSQYNKKFGHYWELQRAKRFLQLAQQKVQTSGNPIFEIKRGRHGGGAWLHEILICDLIAWCDPTVAPTIAELAISSIRDQ
ncbi:MAG TPA: sigma-70 family RNA polymerase sigma factor [Trichocoleus sp.]